jgi:hypothetical protein
MSLKTWTRDFSPRENGRFVNSEVQHIQKLKFILARDDRAEADNYAALSQLYGKAKDLGGPGDDCFCSTVRVVLHRRYLQNAQDSLRVLKFGGVRMSPTEAALLCRLTDNPGDEPSTTPKLTAVGHFSRKSNSLKAA